MNYEIISVASDELLEEIVDRSNRAIKRLDQNRGVLVITDLYGATPGNIACRLLGRSDIQVVTGLNLPMLLKVANYAHEDLETLTQKALLGGKNGIILCNIDLCQTKNDQ
jgi:mannose PTS system EIIA component